MMDRPGDILDIYQQDNGSMLFGLNDMHPKAQRLGLTDLEARIDYARDRCHVAKHVNYDWRQYKKSGPIARTKASQTDAELDSTAGDIHTIVKTYASSKRDSAQRQAARTIREALFPRGVFPITSLKYEEEHAAVASLHERLTTTYAAEVATLGLVDLVDTLGELNQTFGEQLGESQGRVSYDDVLAARREANDAYHKVILTAVTATLDDPEARDELLEVVWDQQDRVARYMKRRGQAPKVDPDTGEVLDEDGQPVEDFDEDVDEPIDQPVPAVD